MKEIVLLLENSFKRELNPLEIKLVDKWIYLDRYQVEYIKVLIPHGEFTLSYLDGLLKRNINKKIIPSETPVVKSEALATFYKMLGI